MSQPEVGTSRRLLFKGGHVVDPLHDRDGILDVLVEDGRIAAVNSDLPVDGAQVVEIPADLVVCPGLIDTPLTAPLQLGALKPIREAMESWHVLNRAGRPEEVAACALFLASDEASFVTGHSLVVDGGWMAGRRVDVAGIAAEAGDWGG